MTSISDFSPRVGNSASQALLYGITVALAAGPLDRLINESTLSSAVRAAAWAVVYAAFAWLAASRRGTLHQALAGVWPLLAMPAYTFASVIWSIRPVDTFVGSLEMTAAIVFGAIMGCRLDGRRFLAVVVVALSLLAVVDLWVVFASPIGLDLNGDAVGIFSHKNANGEIMAVLLLASLAVLVWGGSRLVAAIGLILSLPLLALSGSRTAWVVAAAGAAAIILLFLRRLGGPARLAMLFFGLAMAAAAAIVVLPLQTSLVGSLLEALGKDTTLTGRTVLWDLASGYIHEAPILGHGFNAFWSLDPTTDAAYVDRVLKEDLQSFHNGYLETAVDLGWLGTTLEAALMIGFLYPLSRLMKYAEPSVAAFAMALLLLVIISNFSEVALFVRHGFNLLLLTALWSRASTAARLAQLLPSNDGDDADRPAVPWMQQSEIYSGPPLDLP